MAYQSLYRRYRPQRFGEIRGQRHVVSALQNAVVKGEVGHAYLFHGPRGTGKTTSARVLAKALNCENLSPEGEPCGECESCVAIEQGRSFDLHELDAASNNKVEDMRDLLAKVNLGTPGRAKVYILDEVHMLTSQAENALLKTLEEPPDHVTWVLATTEPHKVVETIRSRCQVFQLTLLGADEMAEHVRWVSQDAGLDVSDEAVEHVVTAGGGSVRDTLSALDRVVAAGGVVEADTTTDTLAQAIAGRDVGAALAAVGDATGRGRDPRTIGEGVLVVLRDAFLTTMGAPPPRLSPAQADRAEKLAALMSPAAMTRAMEALGVSLVEMRQAPDPRVDLEVELAEAGHLALAIWVLHDQLARVGDEEVERRSLEARDRSVPQQLLAAQPPRQAAVRRLQPRLRRHCDVIASCGCVDCHRYVARGQAYAVRAARSQQRQQEEQQRRAPRHRGPRHRTRGPAGGRAIDGQILQKRYSHRNKKCDSIHRPVREEGEIHSETTGNYRNFPRHASA